MSGEKDINVGALDASLKIFVDKLDERVEGAIVKAGLHLLGVAVADAPLDEGTLRGSGSVLLNGRAIADSSDLAENGEGTPAKSGFFALKIPWVVVGFNTPYASYQDQHVELNHPKGGRAGYLTGNFETYRNLYERWIRDAVEATA